MKSIKSTKSTPKNYVTVDGVQYIPNEQVFKVRNKWTLKKLLEKDTATNSLDLKSKLTQYVDTDNSIKFSSDIVTIELPGKIVVKICKSRIESFKDELIIHPLNPSRYIILGKEYNLAPRQRFQPKTKVYSVSDSQDVLEPYSELENSLSFLSKYTFGIELETVGVPLQKSEANQLGFHELYDGSIVGPEYTTGVMKYKNFHHLDYFLNLLKTTSSHDHTCSLHVHIGNVAYSGQNLCSIYSLFQRLQEDLNLLIAPYKKDYKFLYNKQKDHCQNLPLIPQMTENAIKHLFKLPSDTNLEGYLERSAKWNLLGRYYTVNFLNYICKSFPNNTIEIRGLQMSFNYDYVLTWLIINTAIVDYAVNNVKKVLDKREKIQIEDVLTAFITDETVLEKVLSNYYKIKNIIYGKKHIDGDMNTNSMLLDSHLNLLDPVIPSILKKTNKSFAILSKIDINKLAHLRLEINDSDISVGRINVRLIGGYNPPTKSDCKQILTNILQAVENTGIVLDTDSRYVLYGSDILCNGSRMYSHDSVGHYCIIEDGAIHYKVTHGSNTHIVTENCSHMYRRIPSSPSISSLSGSIIGSFASYDDIRQPIRINTAIRYTSDVNSNVIPVRNNEEE